MNEDINNFINNNKEKMLSVLEKIVNMDSATEYKKGADAVGDFLSQKFLEIGLEVEINCSRKVWKSCYLSV